MEKIDISEIDFDLPCGFGTDALVYESKIGNKTEALKIFRNPKDTLNLDNIEKFDDISNLNLNRSLVPISFVLNKGSLIGYLTEFGKKPNIESATTERRIKYLLDLKDSILELHSNGIIHSDIHKGNVILYKDTYCLTDFDNSTYGIYKTKKEKCSDIMEEYISKSGLNERIDIFAHNILTFSLLNRCGYLLVRSKIESGNYGVFNSEEAEKICNSLLLKDNYTSDNFLIDEVVKCKKYK